MNDNIMTKLNQTSSANVNVLGEAELTQVVGGRGNRGGGHRNSWDNEKHCEPRKRRDDNCGYGGGWGGGNKCEDRYEEKYEDCYEEKYEKHCGGRRYS